MKFERPCSVYFQRLSEVEELFSITPKRSAEKRWPSMSPGFLEAAGVRLYDESDRSQPGPKAMRGARLIGHADFVVLVCR